MCWGYGRGGEELLRIYTLILTRLGLKERMSLWNNLILFLLKINGLHVFEIDLLN